MEKCYQEVKSRIVNFRLDFCCWFLPIRIGCFVTACFNIITDFICMVGVANGGFSPTILKVQEALIEDYVTKPPTLLAYTVELTMNIVLLCAVYRKDLALLRIFMYYTIMALVMSFLLYSIIIAAVPMELEVIIVCSTLFQAYTIFVVRSYMVEVRLEICKYELPTLVTMSSLQKKETIVEPVTKTEQEDKTIDVNKTQEVTVVIDAAPVAKPKEDDKDVVKPEIGSKSPIVSEKQDAKYKFLMKPKENVVDNKNVEITSAEVKKDDKTEEKTSTEIKKVDNFVKEEKKQVVNEKKDDKKAKDEKKDDKKAKEEKKDEIKTKQEKKELAKEKKPKEVKSVSSIFRRNKKEPKPAIEVDKATNPETSTDPKADVKLATVRENPKE